MKIKINTDIKMYLHRHKECFCKHPFKLLKEDGSTTTNATADNCGGVGPMGTSVTQVGSSQVAGLKGGNGGEGVVTVQHRTTHVHVNPAYLSQQHQRNISRV